MSHYDKEREASSAKKKTIRDAYIEYKGVFPETEPVGTVISYSHIVHAWGTSRSIILSSWEYQVCTKAEFEAYDAFLSRESNIVTCGGSVRGKAFVGRGSGGSGSFAERIKPTKENKSKYHVQIKGQQVDVYDVLKGFNVTCPAMQHAIKKMLMPGLRGAKSKEQDKREAIQSIERSLELDR